MTVPPVYTFNAIAADLVVAYGWTRPQAEALIKHAALRRYLDQVVYHYMEVWPPGCTPSAKAPWSSGLRRCSWSWRSCTGTRRAMGWSRSIPPVSYANLGGLWGHVRDGEAAMTDSREAGAVVPRTAKRKIGLYPERLRDVVWRRAARS